MKINWMENGDEKRSKSILDRIYQRRLIPPEKKPYVADIAHSNGPFLGIHTSRGPKYLIDAASQIATLGSGYNPSSAIGATHHLESWINSHTSEHYEDVRDSFEKFLRRKLEWEKPYFFFCHSGAEANEIALGEAFQKRVCSHSKKVLAFRNAFHGRLQIALSSTWNPSKREPFEWKSHLTEFSPFPKLQSNEIHQKFPKNWRTLWSEAPSKRFEEILESCSEMQSLRKTDSLLETEISCLLEVRKKLSTREIFSVLVEPLQGEGGDIFASDRFHNALAIMCRAYEVALIYDEVQTGFHLGRSFFWHHLFRLEDAKGQPLLPDYVTLAKKAQVGVIASHHRIQLHEQFNVASLIRGMTQGVILDQYHEDIIEIEKRVKRQLARLSKDFSNLITSPRNCGLEFAFDFKDSKQLDEFVQIRFQNHFMFYPAGETTARFRLNLAFEKEEISLLFSLIRNALYSLEGKASKKLKPFEYACEPLEQKYEFHKILIGWKLKQLKKPDHKISKKELETALEYLSLLYTQKRKGDFSFKVVDKRNIQKFKSAINRLENRNYEPSRRTPFEVFEKCVKNKNGFLVVLLDGKSVAGMAIGSPMRDFPLERGLREDPYFEDPKTIYMFATTVDKEYRGLAFGKLLKFALTLIAFQKGVERIHGRTRDKIARSMLSINFSLGSFIQRYRKEGYLDFEKYRDLVYYTCPLQWKEPPLSLSSGMRSLLEARDLDTSFISQNLFPMMNKLCLSQFVTRPFIHGLTELFALLPAELQHGYTASGLSECVDKVVKSLWKKRAPHQKLLTFDEMFFGHGSFLSRALSGEGEPFFEVDRLPFPSEVRWKEVLMQIKELLSQESYLGVFVEPLTQMHMQRVPHRFLVELKELLKEFNTPLVYNETISQLYRYNFDGFFAAHDPQIRPDIGFAYLGGQMAFIFSSDSYFLETPLTLISTWDGDEMSLQCYLKAIRPVLKRPDDYHEQVERFSVELKKLLADVTHIEMEIENGVGWFSGQAPESVSRLFQKSLKNEKYLVCPSPSAMKRFLEEYC